MTDAFVVQENTALEDTLGYIATLPPGSTVLVVIGPGVYPVYPSDLDVDLIIIGAPARRRLLEGRELQVGYPVIYAVDNSRHFSTTRLLALSGVVLQGSLNSNVLSGGVQLTVSLLDLMDGRKGCHETAKNTST